MTDSEIRPFKQDGRRKWSYCSGLFCNYWCLQFSGCKSINKKHKKALHMGEKCTSVADNSTENVTLCYRNLLLLRWWNVITIALVWSCRVVSKFHYTDPKTLSATRPDSRTKSVHVEIERTGLRPDKVRGLVRDPSEPDRTLSTGLWDPGLRLSPVGSL